MNKDERRWDSPINLLYLRESACIGGFNHAQPYGRCPAVSEPVELPEVGVALGEDGAQEGAGLGVGEALAA